LPKTGAYPFLGYSWTTLSYILSRPSALHGHKVVGIMKCGYTLVSVKCKPRKTFKYMCGLSQLRYDAGTFVRRHMHAGLVCATARREVSITCVAGAVTGCNYASALNDCNICSPASRCNSNRRHRPVYRVGRKK